MLKNIANMVEKNALRILALLVEKIKSPPYWIRETHK